MRRTIQAEQDPDAWVPACAHYCPEYFLMIGCKLLLALGGVRNDCPDDSIFVTPAKAGVQCLSSNGTRNPRHWIPAFAGMTRP